MCEHLFKKEPIILHFYNYFDKVIISKSALHRKEGNMGNNQLEDDEDLFVTLTLEDDSEVDCLVVSIFEAEGKDYIALLPTEGPENEEGEVFIYRYFEDENGEPGLDNIETEAEFYLASQAFDELVEDCEYDEIIDEEELLH